MKHILAVALLMSMFACQPAKEKETETETETPPSADFTMKRNAFFNNLKAPGEAAAQLEATGAEFNGALMADPSKYSSYANDPVKAAANMGIYLADLSYCVAYKRTEKTSEYFKAAHELSKATGIETETLDFLKKRYEENLAKNDSVKAIVDDLLEKSTSDLQGTEREKLAGIAMAAYQIEKLHLALGVIKSYPKDILPEDSRTVILVPVFKLVLSQRENIETIYGFLRSVTDVATPDKNPNYGFYANAFEELIALYKKINFEERLANNQAISLMNDSVVNELMAKVDAIRNKATSIE